MRSPLNPNNPDQIIEIDIVEAKKLSPNRALGGQKPNYIVIRSPLHEEVKVKAFSSRPGHGNQEDYDDSNIDVDELDNNTGLASNNLSKLTDLNKKLVEDSNPSPEQIMSKSQAVTSKLGMNPSSEQRQFLNQSPIEDHPD